MQQVNQYSKQVVLDYEALEPGEEDTWNPVYSEFELTYRLGLFYSLTKALGFLDNPINSLKVLDLGCGNGRSTRNYIDLGLMPEQLVGADLRAGTIKLAKKLNSAIHHITYDGDKIPFPDNSFNWIGITTVISSIADINNRQHLVNDIYEKLQPGGYLFYYDLVSSNDFAGGDLLFPQRIFSELTPIWQCGFSGPDFLPDASGFSFSKLRNQLAIRSRLKKLFNPSYSWSSHTHEVFLARKPA